MIILRAYKTELDPTCHQVEQLLQHAGCARWAYNWGLRKKIESYKATGQMTLSEQIVRRFLARQAETVWAVRDWDNRTEYIRELCWPVNVEVFEPPTWAANVKTFPDEASAMAELEHRMKVIDRQQLQHGFYRHMHSDGRIIYVDSPVYR